MNLDKIKQIAEKKGISIRKLAEVIEKTEQGLHSAIRNNTLKSIDLEKIAQILEVPISYFFEEGENQEISKKIIQNGNGNNLKIFIFKNRFRGVTFFLYSKKKYM